MKRVDVMLRRRDNTGKGAARSARRDGRVPGIIYGGGEDPIAITVDKHDMEVSLHSHGITESILVNMKIEGEESAKEQLGLVRDTQHDPLTGNLEHLDFLRVSADKKITTTVPVELIGTPIGVRDGGVLEHILREVDIECFPLDIPEALNVDVKDMNVGDSIHIYDLAGLENVDILTARERVVALVEMPKMAAATTEEEAPAEGEETEASEETEE